MSNTVLDGLKLGAGAHANFERGACLLEAASYLAGEPWSDHPQCVSPVLGAFGRRLNDLLDDEDRQKLKPFIPRLLNTADDGQDQARRWLASDWAIRVATPRWLDAAGLSEHAERLRALAPITSYASAATARDAARAARDEAWAARVRSREALAEKVKAELANRGWKAGSAAAVAVADADAAAAAAADAAAVAAADAVAVADADAAAAAAADAAADAVADAVAAADAAAAAAAADAAADAAAAAAAADGSPIEMYSDAYYRIYDAVYDAMRAKYKKTIEEDIESRFAQVARINRDEAIELLGRMIDPASSSAAVNEEGN